MNANESCSGTGKSGPYIVIAILSVLVIVLGLKVINDSDRDRPTNAPATASPDKPAKPDATDDGFAAHGLLTPSGFAEFDPVVEAKKALATGDLEEAEKQLEFVRVSDDSEQTLWAQSVTEEIALAKSDDYAKTYLASLDDKLLRFMVALTTSHEAVHEFMDTLPKTDELRKSFEKGEENGGHADLEMPGREFFNYVATWNAFDINLRKHLPAVVKERKIDQPAAKPAATETPAEPEKKTDDSPATKKEPEKNVEPEKPSEN